VVVVAVAERPYLGAMEAVAACRLVVAVAVVQRKRAL
jgi:hypothetical protein